MKYITLTTDFGLEDGYAGVLKGVIWGIAPDAHIADISHLVPPQDLMAGALTLGRAIAYFPPGTVHLAVVDPGVGTQRRPIAARLGPYFVVAPDNGLITQALRRAEQRKQSLAIVHLNKPAFWLSDVSNVFHGRDIFAPVAAHLANGIPLEEMGDLITDPVRLHFPFPKASRDVLHGEIIHIDHFGNLATNIDRSYLKSLQIQEIRFGRHIIRRLACAYGDGSPGELLALIDSSDLLSLCEVNGNAAARLGARIGDRVEVVIHSDW
ncbi:MAG: SAM-dependent chlorinase/fluorinase [Anaerolineae bacterium]|nr:SAM-dependent chlorinase/fluorinase [Anaerolineae bacterium]